MQQALARKWRPREFASLVGQEHVVRALTHALQTQRLHHAYLLTGTRGVGKTTIARIFAKALNCETGISATPCGRCNACVDVDAGRFPDYIELDAASNRGVEEMTQLLEAAVYAPSSGRFKVYVIDEVHMLSNHAFNAMLKTLEEPPAHVKFVLATTDPQKVPVTVLSRCLQFSLKNMPAQAIAEHLQHVLGAEAIEFDAAALVAIARAARGSMRDALSLTDQAIAYSGAALRADAVAAMLGTVSQDHLRALFDALIAGQGAQLIALADQLAARSLSFDASLSDLAALIQRVALAQVGAFSDAGASDWDHASLSDWAARVGAEDLQLFYQIAIHGLRDLPLAPDPHAGFTMTLLRMLAFRPLTDAASEPAPAAGAEAARSAVAALRPSAQPSGGGRAAADSGVAGDARAAPRPAITGQARATAGGLDRHAFEREAPSARGAAGHQRADPAPAPNVVDLAPAPIDFDGDWPALVRRAPAGLVREFIGQSQLLAHQDALFKLRVPVRQYADPAVITKVRDALSKLFGAPVRVEVEVGQITGETAAAQRQRASDSEQAAAEASIAADPIVKTLIDELGATIVPGSIRPNPH